ncbi:MAG: PAS domain S-box protein [Chthoniobacterales bacterium]
MSNSHSHSSDEENDSGKGGLPDVSPDCVEQEAVDEIDNIVPSYGYQMLPMVCLGGSAGGIQALREFFEAMPAESGMVFVVILHLSPEHESTIADILQRSTKMRVKQANDGEKVEANSVYVIPPGKHLTATDGHLRLTPLERVRGKRVAVDLFFRSLADSHGPHSAAIVLSGADGDGALGIKRIKERGGLTIAQDPNEAQTSSMPISAINTGMIDWVLPVQEMPRRLVNYFELEKRVIVPSEDGPQPAISPAPEPSESETALREVLAFLRTRTGRDFSYYKRATILRGISRRMQVNGVDDLPAYLAFLRMHTGEAGALLQDLLISVTNFFRDREAFEALEARIPELFKNKGPSDSVRVWVAACATGEEAYSVVMLLTEYASTLATPPSLQVFATDLHDEVVQIGRNGIYPMAIEEDVSEERLRRFFIKVHDGYRVRREIREAVLFASHDLLKDSPFSRLDMVTCRNLLIYLNREAQARALDIFHFALRLEGLLFLGSSESVEDGSLLFRILDKKFRIYAHQSVARSNLPMPMGSGVVSRSYQVHPGSHSLIVAGRQFNPTQVPLPLPGVIEDRENRPTWSAIHFHLIERLAPPSILVNADYEIFHMSESAGRFLQHTGGEPTKNLLQLVHPTLRIELRATLFRAAQSGEEAEAVRVPFDQNGKPHRANIRVSPVGDVAPGYLLVVFAVEEVSTEERREPSVKTNDSVLQNLEKELTHVKANLRDTIEQYEAGTEELKASNEELQAMNEELRSATEELETSREELQSVNEELTTVNLEMKGNVDELGQANSDLHNLMASTDIATIFLDRELRIMRFTPPAVGLFHLISSDIGRPLADLKHRLEYPSLIPDAASVLKTLAVVRREVSSGSEWYLVRMLPYRTIEDHINGVVLTFVDITESRQAHLALRDSEERMRFALEAANIYGWEMDPATGQVRYVGNRTRVLGFTLPETRPEIIDIIHPEDRARVEDAFEKALAENGRFDSEFRFVHPDTGEIVWQSSHGVFLERNGQGRFVGITHNITERKRSEATRMNFRQIFESAPGKYVVIEPDTCKIMAVSDAYLQATGTTRDTLMNRSIFEIFSEDSQEQTQTSENMRASFERVRKEKRADPMAVQYYPLTNPDGQLEERWWSPVNAPIFGEGGELAYIIHRVEDVTPFIQRKRGEGREDEAFSELEDRTKLIEADIILRGQELQQANEQLLDTRARLEATLSAAEIATWTWDIPNDRLIADKNATRLFAVTPEEAAGGPLSAYLRSVHEDDRPPLEAALAEAMKNGDFEAEYRVYDQDSALRWVVARGVIEFDSDGKPIRFPGVLIDITERKQAETLLLEQKNILELIISGHPLAECLTELTASVVRLQPHARGVILVADEARTRFPHAYSADLDPTFGEGLSDAPISELVTGTTAEGVYLYNPVTCIDIANEEKWSQSWRDLCLAHGIRACHSEPVIGGDGQPIASFLLCFDEARPPSEWELRIASFGAYVASIILERDRAANALSESEEHLRLIVENAREYAIFSMDLDRRVTSWNSGAERLLGFTCDEIIGQPADIIFTPEDRANNIPQTEASVALRDGRSMDERWHIRKNLERFWGSGVMMAMQDGAGKKVGLVKIFRDMTEARLADQARRQAEERFRVFVESVQDYAIFLLDAEGNITSWNQGAARITGYNEEEVLGQHFSLFEVPEDNVRRNLAELEMVNARRLGRSENESWRMRKNGEHYWVNEIMIPLQEGFAKISRDLTERKMFEDELTKLLAAEQTARAEAEAAGHAKDNFLAVLSHELRTPLTPVLMAVYSLAKMPEMGALPEYVGESFAMIQRNILLEARLIDDLLDLTRIVHGKMELERDPVDLHQIVRHAVEISQGDLQAKEQKLEVRLEAESPQVSGDKSRLQQVFWNLLKNASKFTPEQGAITIRSWNEPGSIVVSVTDTGIGIAPESLTQIFEAFTQANETIKRRFGGLGLGLAIANATVTGLGGTLDAQSEGEKKGATFVVRLPILSAKSEG